MPAQLPIALHVFAIKGNTVLLMERQNTGTNDGWWSVPAGRLDVGESATSGVVREALEEVGIQIQKSDLSAPHVMHHKDEKGERVYFFFKTTKWSGEPTNCETDKCSQIGWYAMEDPSIHVLPHAKKAFELLNSGVNYSEYGFDD